MASWVDHMQGTLPADDLRRAFVAGAAWWEFHSSGGTLWPSDRDLAEEEAERRYPGGKPPNKQIEPTPQSVASSTEVAQNENP